MILECDLYTFFESPQLGDDIFIEDLPPATVKWVERYSQDFHGVGLRFSVLPDRERRISRINNFGQLPDSDERSTERVEGFTES